MSKARKVFIALILAFVGYVAYTATSVMQDVQQPSSTNAPVDKKITWVYDKTTDPIRGDTNTAAIDSNELLDLKSPYSGYQRATILVREMKGKREVIISIQKGQLICDFRDCSINAKFDSGAVRKWSTSKASDHSSTVLFIDNAASFIKELQSKKVAYIELEFYQQGVQTLSFNIEGLALKK